VSVSECQGLSTAALVSRCRFILAPQLRSDGKGVFGSTLYSPAKTHRLTMQGDGNLVLYQEAGTGPAALWNSGTQAGTGVFRAILQDDGNFVRYHRDGTNIQTTTWASMTPNLGEYTPHALRVGNDGRVVIYDSRGWSTMALGSGCDGTAFDDGTCCADKKDWADPLSDASCSSWIDYSCDTQYEGYSSPSIVNANCKATCGHCCVDNAAWSDPIGGATCEDWAGLDCDVHYDGYASPDIVRTNCKRTCGLCCLDNPSWLDPVKADGTSSCADWQGLDCNTERPGYAHPDEVKKNCRRTCGLCTFGSAY